MPLRIGPLFLIAVLIYVILMGAFFAYEKEKGENQLLRQRTITKCLGSGGHIGPGLSCWHENPTDKKQGPLP
jgi:hypothetical protein